MPMAKLAESIVQADELLEGSPTNPPTPPPSTSHGPIPIARHSRSHLASSEE